MKQSKTSELTTSVLQELHPFIQMRARQSAPPGERRDVAQELRTAVIERMPKHDPARASAAGFGAMVVDRARISHLRKKNAQKRVPPGHLQSIDTVAAIPHRDPWPATDLAMDVRDAIESFPPESPDRAFLEALLHEGSADMAARSLGISKRAAEQFLKSLSDDCRIAGLRVYR